METTKRLELIAALHELTATTLACISHPPFDLHHIETLTLQRQELVASLGQLSDTVLDFERPAIVALHELSQELELVCGELTRLTAKEILERRPTRQPGPSLTPAARIVSQSA